MLRVLVKVATFVNGAVHKAGEEITIMHHLFSEEVHEIIEDLGLSDDEPAPPAAEVSPPSEPPIPADIPTTNSVPPSDALVEDTDVPAAVADKKKSK